MFFIDYIASLLYHPR